MDNRKAFTIVELLVTVFIISLLASIVLMNLTQTKGRSRDIKRLSDIALIQQSLGAFFDRCSTYPATLDLTYECPMESSVTFSSYITKIPLDPTGVNPYEYSVNNPTVPTDYVLKATLETNNVALTDVLHNAYSTYTPNTVDCTPVLAYCVIPR